MFTAATCLTQSAGHFASIKDSGHWHNKTYGWNSASTLHTDILYPAGWKTKSPYLFKSYVCINEFIQWMSTSNRKRERKNVRILLWARLSEATKTKPDVKETLFLNLYFHVMVNATNYSYIRLQSYSVMTSF